MLGRRDRQEDCYAFCEWESEPVYEPLVGVLADGMGGHEGGDLASKIALQFFIDVLPNERLEDPVSVFKDALQRANDVIAERTQGDDFGGTTLVGFSVAQDHLHWISVGDSYLLLFRDGKLRRLNEDHSMRPELLIEYEAGKISKEGMESHPDRNALRSYLAGVEIPMIDQNQEPFALQNRDMLIVASDGIDDLVYNDSLEQLLAEWKEEDASSIADRIMEAVEALEDDEQDNTSVMVIKVP